MTLISVPEIVGYVAMTLLVLSFTPKNIKTIRIINLIACLCFLVYGILLGWKFPIIISNALVSIIQIYHLFFAKKPTEKPSETLS